MNHTRSGSSEFVALRCNAALFALVLLSTLALAPGQSAAELNQTGRWTPTEDWSDGDDSKHAVHMILLRADGNPFHSRILWFRSETDSTFHGGEWGWRRLTDDCEIWPSSTFKAIPVDTSGVDLLCAGHATLADGRLLLAGGTHPVTGTYGENKSRIFTPGPVNRPGIPGGSNP